MLLVAWRFTCNSRQRLEHFSLDRKALFSSVDISFGHFSLCSKKWPPDFAFLSLFSVHFCSLSLYYLEVFFFSQQAQPWASSKLILIWAKSTLKLRSPPCLGLFLLLWTDYMVLWAKLHNLCFRRKHSLYYSGQGTNLPLPWSETLFFSWALSKLKGACPYRWT